MTDRNTGKRNNGDIDQPENNRAALILHPKCKWIEFTIQKTEWPDGLKNNMLPPGDPSRL